MNRKTTFHYQADLITDSGEEFRITANDYEIKIFPRSENFGFNTFMRIYKMVVEKIDSDAEFKIQNDKGEYHGKN